MAEATRRSPSPESDLYEWLRKKPPETTGERPPTRRGGRPKEDAAKTAAYIKEYMERLAAKSGK